MSFACLLRALTAVGAAADRPPAALQGSLGVSATVVRQVSVASFQATDDTTAVLIAGDSYNAQIDDGVLDRPTGGLITIRPKADRPAVLTIIF